MKSEQYSMLKTDEVHIWLASFLDAENDEAYLFSLLSEDERERAHSFKFIKDQKRYIIARGILRSLLAKYLNEAPQTIEIIYGLWGKPCLLPKRSLRFNISHSGNYILYAMTLVYEIGVDIEYKDRNIEIDDIMLDMLPNQELNLWNRLNKKDKRNYFFKLWVCKEAFLKASGKGWLESRSKIILEESDLFMKDQKNTFLKKKVTYPYFFECIDGYASALFVEGPSLRPCHYTWSLNV